MKFARLLSSLFVLSVLSLTSSLKADLNSDPWQLNIYAINSIGSANGAYSGASFGGLAGSGGNSYLSGIGLNTTGVSSTYSMYAGGNLTISGSSTYNGGLTAGGNINYSNTTTVGNVTGGGNLTGNSGSVSGNVTLAGTNQAGSGLTISGTVAQGTPYTSPLNQSAVSSYFQKASSFWAGLNSTATWSNVYGQIVVSNLQAGRNIVNITLADLNAAYGIALNGPSNAFVVFNITDTSGTLKNVSYAFSGGIGLNDVIFNLPNSTSLSMSGGTYASVLAVNSTITYSNGQLQGNLIANNLLGNGSVTPGSFIGFAADQSNFNVVAPEPSTYLMLGSFLAAAAFFRARVRSKNPSSS